jgi:hypothetical protein
MEKKFKVFCRGCGARLLIKKIGAENYEEGYMEFSYHPHSPYNEDTGERQYVRYLRCPNKRWWNLGHTAYLEEVLV